MVRVRPAVRSARGPHGETRRHATGIHPAGRLRRSGDGRSGRARWRRVAERPEDQRRDGTSRSAMLPEGHGRPGRGPASSKDAPVGPAATGCPAPAARSPCSTIIAAVEPEPDTRVCILRGGPCGLDGGCAVHLVFADAREAMLERLDDGLARPTSSDRRGPDVRRAFRRKATRPGLSGPFGPSRRRRGDELFTYRGRMCFRHLRFDDDAQVDAPDHRPP